MTTMKIHKIDFPLQRAHEISSLLQKIILLVVILAASLNTWAATGTCNYASSGTGMGGTGAKPADETTQMLAAGNVIFSRGKVEAQSMGRTRLLAKGTQVCVGETIATSETGMVQIRMLDTGFISVRPDTQIRIDAFQFNGKEDGTEKSAFYLVQGAFRAVTGLIGHLNKENYKINTPTATIGIRGTDHEPMFIPNPAPGQVALGEPGTYDKVNSGGVFITTSTGSVEVKPNQVGFAPIVPSLAPVILKEIPRFYNVESGAESKSNTNPSESLGSHGGARDAQDKAIRPEHTSKPEIHAPVVHVPGVHASEIQSPDLHTSENQGSDNRTSAVQAPAVQAPAVQAPAVQAPAVQVPAVQVPAVQVPVSEAPEH